MAVFINSTTIQGTTAVKNSLPVDMTGANLILFSLIQSWSGNTTLSDNLGNSYNSNGSSIVQVIVAKGGLSSCLNPLVSASMVFTLTDGANNAQTGIVAGYKIADSFDANNTMASSTGSTELTQNSITAAGSPALIASLVGKVGDAGNCISVDNGFTIIEDVPFISGDQYGQTLAVLAQSVAAAVAPKFTFLSIPSGSLVGQQTSFLMDVDPIVSTLWARSVL